MKRWWLFALLLAAAASLQPVMAAPVVFAAASLADVLHDVANAYEAEGHGHVALSFAASSTLARQIEEGAPAGLFISADEDWMDELSRRHLIVETSRKDLLANELVIVSSQTQAATIEPSRPRTILNALGEGRIALGDPAAVPAGKYAKAAFMSLGLWDVIAPHVASGDSVRSALALVQRGEARLGVVYGTDALAASGVTVVFRFPEQSHPKIVYPMAVIQDNDSPEVRDFANYLTTSTARALFERRGFRFPDR